jgi:CheY-like chemotaxis protein
MTALVVDDEPAIRTLVSRTLRGAGIHVLEAYSGASALALVRAARPDVIVTDIEMPQVDGVELCRQLRTDTAFKDLLIVVMTGAGPSQRDEAIAAGCDAVLEKPCSPKLLLATIQRLSVKPS